LRIVVFICDRNQIFRLGQLVGIGKRSDVIIASIWNSWRELANKVSIPNAYPDNFLIGATSRTEQIINYGLLQQVADITLIGGIIGGKFRQSFEFREMGQLQSLFQLWNFQLPNQRGSIGNREFDLSQRNRRG